MVKDDVERRLEEIFGRGYRQEMERKQRLKMWLKESKSYQKEKSNLRNGKNEVGIQAKAEGR